jgi:asparagine synthase (glutamine-hydrolysing)
MCGLVGWFSSERIEKDKDALRIDRMINAIFHRGPDGNGVLLRDNAVLGHVRLAIIDLETGTQPMTYLESNVHIVFNGEIYNYKELKENLKKGGHVFRTTSDTEVILAMYMKYGMDAFQYLRGMFAIGLWDEKRNRGLLIRDQYGIKPLFYHVSDSKELVFSSEAKGILARDNLAGKLNVDSLHLLMNFRYLPNEQTMFQNIEQLSPGEIIEWTPDKPLKKYKFNYLNVATEDSVLKTLEESVRLHLTADVEVGTYLSGGIDSACISKFANKYNEKKLRTFTLNVGDDPDEVKNAKKTALLLGLGNVTGNNEGDAGSLLPKLIWHLEVPKINALQTSKVATLASRDVKVVMSGLGGDELFLGYNAHRIMLLADRVNHLVPKNISKLSSAGIMSLLNKFPLPIWSEQERAVQMLGSFNDWSRVYGIMRNVWDNPLMRQKIYGSRMLDENLPNAFGHLESTWPDNDDPVEAMAQYEWRHKMVNDLLWQEDRCSMAQGLEVRVPFLDPVLVEQIKMISRNKLMQGNKPKAFMRNMLKDVLPAEILSRPKSGFQVNAASFFQDNLSELSGYYLSREKIQDYGLFNPDFVAEVLSYRVGTSTRWHYFMLYMMMMCHIWLEIFERRNASFQFENLN